MKYLIILATLMVAFFITFYSYRKGLQDGLNINKGKDIPKTNINPISPIFKHIEDKKEKDKIDKITEGLENILNYDGTDQAKKVSK